MVLWFTVSEEPSSLTVKRFSNPNVCVELVVTFPYDEFTHPMAETCQLAVVWYSMMWPPPDDREVVVFAANSDASWLTSLPVVSAHPGSSQRWRLASTYHMPWALVTANPNSCGLPSSSSPSNGVSSMEYDGRLNDPMAVTGCHRTGLTPPV
jgi:hypothetical protein